MLDKNKDGRVSATELTSKAEMAFKALDKDHDGFITKEEFARIHKTMSPKQVVRVKTNKSYKVAESTFH